MNLRISIHLSRYLSFLAILILSPTVMASDWSFQGDKDDGCVLVAAVNDKASGNKIATLGMIKLSNDYINKISGFEREIFISDIGFMLEIKKRRLQAEVGVGVQVTSESVNTYFSYIPSSREGSEGFVYTLPNTESLHMVDAFMNKEKLTLEFNTSSSEVKYGIITSGNFIKSYKKFNQCVKTLG